ncbi:MAG: FCD domain-containing protein [Thermoleophilia bacterium]|nr:FCD domain-containing protein [Thermoleophilia bacterium]
MTEFAPAKSGVILNTETASDSAVRYLRGLIFSGELGPGDKLPPERELSARLGISRMTVRLALKVLESSGYIVTTRGARGGSRVADSESLVECWKIWMQKHAEDLDDIFELRLTVETRLAELAAQRRTEADLASIAAAIARERSAQDWSAIFRSDVDIHKSIARAARSPRLERAMLEARAEFFVPINLARFETRQHQVHDSHRDILEAIRAKDSQRAAAEMRQHLLLTRDLTDRALEAAGLKKSSR